METREVASEDEFHPELRIVDANGLEWQRYGSTPPLLVPPLHLT
ncbi:hypothetical protein ACF1G0_32925 [Streptomyces sp. NPDC013953]